MRTMTTLFAPEAIVIHHVKTGHGDVTVWEYSPLGLRVRQLQRRRFEVEAELREAVVIALCDPSTRERLWATVQRDDPALRLIEEHPRHDDEVLERITAGDDIELIAVVLVLCAQAGRSPPMTIYGNPRAMRSDVLRSLLRKIP
jgi:hypothetical protein